MAHTIHDKDKLMLRLKKIQGQTSALEKQLYEDADCTAILQQIAAIRGAVNGLMAAVMEEHLIEHVVKEKDNMQREQEAHSVLKIIKSYLK